MSTVLMESTRAAEPAPDSGRTRYHLSGEQVQFFDENGYLVLRDWIPPALRRYREAYPGAAQFDWRVSEEYRPVSLGDEDVELKVAHTAHTLGSYCSAGDAPGRKAG
jgi:DNA-binding transcriptional LysR family regulator